MATIVKHNAGKFFLMENCPDRPTYYRNQALKDYEQALQSIPAIEIINPEVLFAFVPLMDTISVKDGDFFPLPDTVGYEKEYQYRERRPLDMKQLEWKRIIYTMDEDGHEFRTVVRLYVKDEKECPIEGDCIYTGSTHCQCMTDKKMPCVRTGIVKDEKGETQEEMWNEVIQTIGSSDYINYGNEFYSDLLKQLSNFTITRKP